MVKTTTDTRTKTETYTKPRIDIIEDHFELFIRCSGMEDEKVKKFLLSVERHELKAVGVYIMENECRIAEVELEIDWKEHSELTRIYGDFLDTDQPGWTDGVAPEAYVAVRRLAEAAKEHNLKIGSWIRVSDEVRQNEKEHKRVCSELGYIYNGSVPKWKETPKEHAREIMGLPEAKVTRREI